MAERDRDRAVQSQIHVEAAGTQWSALSDDELLDLADDENTGDQGRGLEKMAMDVKMM